MQLVHVDSLLILHIPHYSYLNSRVCWCVCSFVIVITRVSVVKPGRWIVFISYYLDLAFANCWSCQNCAHLGQAIISLHADALAIDWKTTWRQSSESSIVDDFSRRIQAPILETLRILTSSKISRRAMNGKNFRSLALLPQREGRGHCRGWYS